MKKFDSATLIVVMVGSFLSGAYLVMLDVDYMNKHSDEANFIKDACEKKGYPHGIVEVRKFSEKFNNTRAIILTCFDYKGNNNDHEYFIPCS